MHLAKCRKKEQRPRPICWFNGFFFLKIDLENWVLGFQVLKNLIYFFSFFFPTFLSNQTMRYCLLVEDGSIV